MNQEETSAEQPHVLVVDDSRLMRVAIKKILQQDYQLTEAVDGEDAWEAITNDESIQIVISDLNMPNLDGFELLEKIRAHSDERIKNIPVIIITGIGDDGDLRTRALECGASDFVTKPFDSVQLKARTRSHTKHDETTRRLNEVSTELEKNIIIDPLTNLANKRHFYTKGHECVSFSKRHNANISLILLDIDLFDLFFVKCGSEYAYKAIKTVADILESSLRMEDTAARIGLSRFALLLVNIDQAGVSELAQRIQTRISKEPFSTPLDPVLLTTSMGVASTEAIPDYDFEKLMSAAEKAIASVIEKGGKTIEYAENTAIKEEPKRRTITVVAKAGNKLSGL